MKKYIARQIDSEVEILKSIVGNFDREKDLIINTRIMIIIKDDVELPNYVKIVLNQFNTVKRNLSSIENIHSDFNDYKLIFYYNEGDNKWDDNWSMSGEHTKLLDFINTKYNGGVLYFGNKINVDKISINKKHLISASNFSSQIYGNMLNLIKLIDSIRI